MKTSEHINISSLCPAEACLNIFSQGSSSGGSSSRQICASFYVLKLGIGSWQ